MGKDETGSGALGDGEAGQLATVFNLYESSETVLLLPTRAPAATTTCNP